MLKLQVKDGMPPLRGLGSIRLSVMKDETTSPTRQRTSINSTADVLGVEVRLWAEDLNVSASEVEPAKRPSLGPYLTDQVDEWDVIFFWKQDRAARSMHDMSFLLDFCKKNHKVLVICEQPGQMVYDFRPGMSDNQESIFATMGALFFSFAAAIEVANIKLRVKSAHEYLRLNGEWGGGRFPFGYEPVKAEGDRGFKLVRHEKTFAIVREIVDRLIEGDAQLSIAEDFNERGILTPFDYWDKKRNPEKFAKRQPRKWATTAIGKMMRSRALLGESVYEGKVVVNDNGVPIGRCDKPIVNAEEWDLLQAALTEKSITKVRYAGESETLQVARCGGCGGAMYSQELVAKGRTYSNLKCKHRQKQYGASCNQPSVGKGTVEEVLKETLMTAIGDTQVMRRRYQLGDNVAEELANVIRLRESLQKEQDLGLVTDEEQYFRRLKDFVETERRLRDTPSRKAGYVWEPTGKTYRDIWETLDSGKRRKLLLDLGIKIYVGSPENFEAGDKAWQDFSQDSELGQLPSEQWFTGIYLNPDDVVGLVGEYNGIAYVDGVPSSQRSSDAPIRRYKAKPIQMCLVRTGDRSIQEQLAAIA